MNRYKTVLYCYAYADELLMKSMPPMFRHYFGILETIEFCLLIIQFILAKMFILYTKSSSLTKMNFSSFLINTRIFKVEGLRCVKVPCSCCVCELFPH